VEAYLSLQGKITPKAPQNWKSDEELVNAQNAFRKTLWLKTK
jgi:hypothetical protein